MKFALFFYKKKEIYLTLAGPMEISLFFYSFKSMIILYTLFKNKASVIDEQLTFICFSV